MPGFVIQFCVLVLPTACGKTLGTQNQTESEVFHCSVYVYKLIYYEGFDSIVEAIAREKYIKGKIMERGPRPENESRGGRIWRKLLNLVTVLKLSSLPRQGMYVVWAGGRFWFIQGITIALRG